MKKDLNALALRIKSDVEDLMIVVNELRKAGDAFLKLLMIII